MKKILSNRNKTSISFSLLLVSLVLASCGGVNKRKGIFLPGTFEGYRNPNKDLKCCFSVSEISIDDYLMAAGQNVVQDLVALKYYSLDLYIEDKSGTRIDYEISNLSDMHNESTEVPVAYTNSNIEIWPCINSVSDSQTSIKICYLIQIYDFLNTNEAVAFDLYLKGN